ncbi:NUDIX domain-containing protein [Paenalkalicoccus suaedae]|uniref:NUDIX domain-containing protein n=1 Tax=Paenalkalicoccus suaedae TaxID=2592382 RepID=A0A859FGU5_9BACI|nr:NUDIX domain-containing protein [Paenalkalicoccus suaedae]QKS71874.1 NUDIX domain-containing protein [Paenalkalicoccus suaedae]
MEYYKKLRQQVGKQELLLPGAAIIIYQDDRVLLQHRDDGDWGLPGGLMELGESFQQTVGREVREETGLELRSVTLFGLFSGENYYVEAPNGDPYYAVTALYISEDVEGELQPESEETLDLQYFSMNALPTNLRRSHAHFLTLFKDREHGVVLDEG